MFAQFTVRRLLIVASAVCAFLGFSQFEARAATDIYMMCAGVPGSSLSARHRDWIEIQSFELSVGGASSAHITKVKDAASTRLMHAATTRAPFPKCTVEFEKAGGAHALPYLTYTMENVMVSSYNLSSGGDRPMESISLNFTKIETREMTCSATGVCTASTPTPAPNLMRNRPILPHPTAAPTPK